MLPVLVALVRSAQATKQSQVVCASMLHKFGPGTPQETSHEMPLSSSSHSPRPEDHKGNSMFCAPRVHKFGPERTWGTFPKALCARESLSLSPVRDCSGFVMTDNIRCLFAKCQAPFCPIGSESRVPGQPGFRCQKDDLPLAKRAPLSAKASITGIVGCFGLAKLIGASSRYAEWILNP